MNEKRNVFDRNSNSLAHVQNLIVLNQCFVFLLMILINYPTKIGEAHPQQNMLQKMACSIDTLQFHSFVHMLVHDMSLLLFLFIIISSVL